MDDDNQAAFHQMMLERQQEAEEALADLAMGVIRQAQVEYLAAFAHIRSPYEEKHASHR